jgi:uncharacterized protein
MVARPDALFPPSHVPSDAPRPLPAEPLDPRVVGIWRLEWLLWAGIPLTLISAGFAYGVLHLVLDWSLPVAAIVPVAVVVLVVLAAVIEPGLRYRSWRWSVSDDEVDTQSGVITRTRRLVPMARIQHVDTRSEFFERQRGLATVVIYTAAGSSTVPGLPAERANGIRDQIATLANTYEDV